MVSNSEQLLASVSSHQSHIDYSLYTFNPELLPQLTILDMQFLNLH